MTNDRRHTNCSAHTENTTLSIFHLFDRTAEPVLACDYTWFMIFNKLQYSLESSGFHSPHSQEVRISEASLVECDGRLLLLFFFSFELTCSWRPRPLCNHDSTQQAHQMPRSTKRLEADQYGSSGYYWKTTEHEGDHKCCIMARHTNAYRLNIYDLFRKTKSQLVKIRGCSHTNRSKDVQQGHRDLLELLEGLVVQVETRVSSQVELLKLGGQVLREGDLTQLITAQIHTLTRRGEDVTTADTCELDGS